MAGIPGRAPLALLTALLVAPAAALGMALYLGRGAPEELAQQRLPILAAPTVRTLDGEARANLSIEFRPTRAVLSSGAPGLVTGVSARAGETLRSGAPVYSVDGVTRRLFVSAAPLFRPLELGDSGSDVMELERFLIALGYRGGHADRRFDVLTRTAVRSYQSKNGMRSPTGVFEPQLVVWAADEVTIGSVEVHVGSTAPGTGEPVVKVESSIKRARLVAGEGSGSQLSGPLDVMFGGAVMGTVTDPGKIPVSLAETIIDKARKAGGGDLSTGVSGAAGEAGGDAKDEGVKVPVTVRFPVPKTSFAVPTSAVMVDARGDGTCVWVAATDAGRYDAVPVQVTAGDLGTTEIDGSVTGRRVLVNPAKVLDVPTCPSR